MLPSQQAIIARGSDRQQQTARRRHLSPHIPNNSKPFCNISEPVRPGSGILLALYLNALIPTACRDFCDLQDKERVNRLYFLEFEPGFFANHFCLGVIVSEHVGTSRLAVIGHSFLHKYCFNEKQSLQTRGIASNFSPFFPIRSRLSCVCWKHCHPLNLLMRSNTGPSSPGCADSHFFLTG